MPYIIGIDNVATTMLLITSLLIALYAQNKINRTYKEYKTELSRLGLSGQEVARKILDKHGLNKMYVVKVRGNLTDHYDPRNKTVKLSSEVFDGTSLASISIAAHEVGHAIQDKENYRPMRIRTALVPVVNFISKLSYFVIILSFIIGMTGYIYFGILMIVATLIFQLVTLPVEFDASRRALKELEDLNITSGDEIEACKKVLKAAAFTYVASVITSILNLIRLALIADRD